MTQFPAGADFSTDSTQAGETFTAVYHTPMKIWVCVATIVLGFTLGGVAFVAHSIPLAVVGGVLFVLGGIAALAFGIMENVH